ncbi:hypothetical protein [Aurantiacibacter poecillastricola]|uniref:hypothetical protein n=1 Tax=Aurantiacibacter poecillastricola TaxID=3064385 RepID=UPI00273D8505|nr:hypothetical protein [Aurantiacibacter sp. 219JJ12-13]MDP5261790.1 hypothetical protein [Aurantiacibacter sp. 219JJ12-13]
MQKNYRLSGVGMLDAAPGTYLVHAYFDDNQVDLVKSNIIGWQVGQDRRLTPLLLDPRAVDQEGWVVLHPDGRIENEDGQSWPNEDAWLVHERRERRAEAH